MWDICVFVATQSVLPHPTRWWGGKRFLFSRYTGELHNPFIWIFELSINIKNHLTVSGTHTHTQITGYRLLKIITFTAWNVALRTETVLPFICFYFTHCLVTSSPPCTHTHTHVPDPISAGVSATTRGHIKHSTVFEVHLTVNMLPSRPGKVSHYTRHEKIVLFASLRWITFLNNAIFLVGVDRSITFSYLVYSMVNTTRAPTEGSCINTSRETRCWNIVLWQESGYALVITFLQG